MRNETLLELSNDAGLISTVVLTFNFLLGMLLATAFRTQPWWKRIPVKIQQWDINELHNYTAYVALGFVLLHILFLLLDKASKFSFKDVLYPIRAPHQEYVVLFGSLSLYALVVVIVTAQKLIKRKMSFRLWKNIHLISYCTVFLFVFHGIFMDPHLQDNELDIFDGEKLISVICGLLLITASALRYRYYRKKIKPGNNKVVFEYSDN